jgi:hypothetical protein
VAIAFKFFLFSGSVRRECLDHVIVFRAMGLQRLMNQYCAYYHQWRTHLSLEGCSSSFPNADCSAILRLERPEREAVVDHDHVRTRP